MIVLYILGAIGAAYAAYDAIPEDGDHTIATNEWWPEERAPRWFFVLLYSVFWTGFAVYHFMSKGLDQ